MRKRVWNLPVPSGLLLALPFMILACGDRPQKEAGEETAFVGDPLEHVNPFIGTAPLTDPEFIGYEPPENWRVWAGLTFPGSSLPNAMVQLSPITQYGSGAGYEYEDNEIIGFAHTNKGHWNLCNIPVLPVSGEAEAPFASTFEKSGEAASPAYYQVSLKDFGIDVRLTSTLRAGFHEYTYNQAADRKVVFDLGRSNNRVRDWAIEKVSGTEVQGFQRMGEHETIYFHAVLSEPVQGITKENEGSPGGYALVDLGTGGDKVSLKLGLSFVSSTNAKANLETEIGDKGFDEIHQAGRGQWKELLGKIQIAGGTPKQQQMFYSSLYRSFLWPALRSDANGEYTDNEGVVKNGGFGYYTNPSLWDTYRNKVVLMAMLRPEVTGDIIQSMVDKGTITGFMPTFFHGDHAAPFIANAHAQGIDNFDVQKAHELLVNNAYKDGGTRPHILEYMEKGFISEPEIHQPHVETVAHAGVSKTLEYALDDYSLALFGKAIQDTTHYRDLMRRSKNYKNVFDPKTHFMRGRLADGSWIEPFDPEYPYYEYMYREANAWQVSFYAPHDMEGLVETYGGPQKFEEKLDSLFTLPWNHQHIARNVSSFIGQYCHGNQPDHEAPFSYYFVDKPEKSQDILDKILNEFYGVGDQGLALSGMDDAGEMSAWYVFSSTGLYPLSPADNEYLVSLPLFDHVRYNLGDKGFNILLDGDSRNLESLELNGEVWQEYFIGFDSLKQGGTLKIGTVE